MPGQQCPVCGTSAVEPDAKDSNGRVWRVFICNHTLQQPKGEITKFVKCKHKPHHPGNSVVIPGKQCPVCKDDKIVEYCNNHNGSRNSKVKYSCGYGYSPSGDIQCLDGYYKCGSLRKPIPRPVDLEDLKVALDIFEQFVDMTKDVQQLEDVQFTSCGISLFGGDRDQEQLDLFGYRRCRIHITHNHIDVQGCAHKDREPIWLRNVSYKQTDLAMRMIDEQFTVKRLFIQAEVFGFDPAKRRQYTMSEINNVS